MLTCLQYCVVAVGVVCYGIMAMAVLLPYKPQLTDLLTGGLDTGI